MRIVLGVALCLLATPVFAAPDAPMVAATRWLSLVDHGQYDQSWSQAAAMIRTRLTEAEWSRAVSPLRQSLGQVLSRKLSSERATHTMPGAPDQDYTVLRFDTRFANKQAATETVVWATGSIR